MRKTIAIVGTGDMGSAVGAALIGAGHRVVTDLSGRSAHSRELAARADLEDLGTLKRVAAQADLVLSILPPAEAFGFAERMAQAAVDAGARPLFVDCNAVAPAKAVSIGALIEKGGSGCLDVGIVGRAPGKDPLHPTRFYVSGPERRRLLELGCDQIHVVDMGPELGRGSAIKMAYASITKGADALFTAALMAAQRLGVRAELMEELICSQRAFSGRMAERIPYLAATAERFTGEMREIAATYESVGVTASLHRGAEWVYETLAATPLGEETRATSPAHRSLDEAIDVFCAALAPAAS
jgi:3-hydroxyisobutyrate dehydrogenase-like beta-hydroxyacid dehydrogenase